MSAAPKKAYDTLKASRTARSRCSIRSGRRANGATNATHSAIQIHGELTARPNAPGSPRAIRHVTCCPVQTWRTRPVRSSTMTRAISSLRSLGCAGGT